MRHGRCRESNSQCKVNTCLHSQAKTHWLSRPLATPETNELPRTSRWMLCAPSARAWAAGPSCRAYSPTHGRTATPISSPAPHCSAAQHLSACYARSCLESSNKTYCLQRVSELAEVGGKAPVSLSPASLHSVHRTSSSPADFRDGWMPAMPVAPRTAGFVQDRDGSASGHIGHGRWSEAAGGGCDRSGSFKPQSALGMMPGHPRSSVSRCCSGSAPAMPSEEGVGG